MKYYNSGSLKVLKKVLKLKKLNLKIKLKLKYLKNILENKIIFNRFLKVRDY
jgi:hypothetical protein